jgi:hypothetical protein
VSGEIVEDNADLLALRTQGDGFFEEGDEVVAGVASGGLSMDAARCRFQRCI